MNNKPALIMTAAVAVLAAISLIFAAVILTKGNNGDSESNVTDDRSSATDDLINDAVPEELFAVAQRLIRDNYEILRLFYLISYDESHFEQVYDNPPEAVNGYYILKRGVIDYETVDEIFALVDSTLSQESAHSLKFGDSVQTGGNGSVYTETDGKIGVNELYQPLEYDLTWESVPVKLFPMGEGEYLIEIVLNGKDGDKVEKSMSMSDVGGGEWRLNSLIY